MLFKAILLVVLVGGMIAVSDAFNAREKRQAPVNATAIAETIQGVVDSLESIASQLPTQAQAAIALLTGAAAALTILGGSAAAVAVNAVLGVVAIAVGLLLGVVGTLTGAAGGAAATAIGAAISTLQGLGLPSLPGIPVIG